MLNERPLQRPLLAALVTCLSLGMLFPAVHNATAQSGVAFAQSASENSTELDQILFVQILPPPKGFKNGKEAYSLAWIPAPIQKYCMGKTHENCATMDFCLRTTTPNVSMCRNLGSALTRMPHYPPNISPRRMLSIALLPPSTMKGFDLLEKLAATMPRSSPQVFTMSARVKARVRLTRKPDDDDLSVLEILAVAPF